MDQNWHKSFVMVFSNEWKISSFHGKFLKFNYGFKKNLNFNSGQTEISRLPAQYNISSLTPDHNYISGPNVTSNDPRDWLLYPTGIIFKINAKKLPVKTGPSKRKRSVSPTAGSSRKITPWFFPSLMKKIYEYCLKIKPKYL